MDFRDLFNRTVSTTVTHTEIGEPTAKGEAVAAGKPKTKTTTSTSENRQGVFVTPQSITTFPVMGGVISGFWTMFENVLNIPHNLWIGGGISLLAGIFLFAVSETDGKKPADPRWWVRVVVALVNTGSLFGMAAGYGTIFKAMGPG
jgi:hypothetical protein